MSVRIIQGDCLTVLRTLPDTSVNCCVTSPPYWGLRDYGCAGQIGLERTPEEYVAALVSVFAEVRRVLRDDGTLWLNLGDSYNGYMANHRGTGLETERQSARKYIEPGAGLRTDTLKQKDLVGIPWRVAFALQGDGWYLRQDIIWQKPNPMPESVTDRCTKAHEYIFLLSKSPRYYYDAEAIKEPSANGIQGGSASWRGERTIPSETRTSWKGSAFDDGKNAKVHPNVGRKRKPAGWNTAKGAHGSFHPDGRAKVVEYTDGVCETRNRRSVWTVPTFSYSEAHFATFPPDLIRPCILAGCPVGGTVLDPFGGSGTTGEVAEMEGRNSILVELNADYVKLAQRRTAQRGLFTGAK